MKKIYFLLAFVCMTVMSFGQNATISGTVGTDDGPAIGAVAKLAGTTKGAITDLEGNFVITEIVPGDYNLVVSSVGYEDYSLPVSLGEGENLSLGSLTLSGGSLAIQGVEIIADVVIDRKTPVAVSNIDGQYIADKTGNQELTTVIATAPSVYAAQGDGGFGNSRLVVRGFDDRNVVVMVNGVPVNDMENQRLFWSNWAGLADVASKIQIQRGLGASMLSVPSVGGTVNIISKATDLEKGGWVSSSIGNDMFRKHGFQFNSGELGNGWAFTLNGTRTSGDGYVDGTLIDAYSYFGAITKDWKNHSISFTGFGAPQRHGNGQGNRLTLSQFVANADGGDYETFINDHRAHDFNGRGNLVTVSPDGTVGTANSIRYNSGWGYADFDVNTGFTHRGVYNTFSNFYHKPQVSLSHYWDAKDRLDIISNVYGSWGRGGGTSVWGDFPTAFVRGGRLLSGPVYQAFERDADGTLTRFGGPVDWAQVLADNVSQNPDGLANFSDGEDFYFLRASMNHHNYYGLISKAIYDINDEVTFTGGIDGRTYFADHVRKAIDMFGLQGYVHDDFGSQTIAVADNSNFGYSDESLFNRNNTAYVNWIGGFSELEFDNDKFTATLGASLSNKSYRKVQRVTSQGRDGESDWFNFLGGAIKGGASYSISDALNVYGNAGYLSIQPIFDNVFLGENNGGVSDGFVNDDAENEKVFAVELGAGVSTAKFAANLNLYSTSWQDRAITVFSQSPTNPDILNPGNATGIDALHYGTELDLLAQPVNGLSLTGNLSLGNWTWQNNSPVQIFDEITNELLVDETIYLEDVRVGNAPQSQFGIGADYTSSFGLGLFFGYQHNMDHYSNFSLDPDPEDGDISDVDRLDPSLAGVDSNKLPDFGLADAGISYTVPLTEANSLRFHLNVNNVFDKLYVNQARENVSSDGTIVTYAPLQNLVGNFGLGRTWNAGAKFDFGDNGGRKEADINVPMPTPQVDMMDVDSDGDGVLDSKDDCPDVAGSVMGCPDSDGDGVIDADDDCPTEAGLALDGGCPVEMEVTEIEVPEPEVIVEERIVEVEVNSDSDGDGVVDSKDNCPDVAGAITNYGCPVVSTPAPVVTPAPSVEVVERLNFIAKNVYFNTNSDVIRTDSRTILNEIATIMNQYPGTSFVIEGHTDNTGDAEYNRDLSQRRAQSVVNYLVGKGISGSLLSAIGYGEDRPIASNDTREGRQQNRRVVIRIR